MHPLVLIVFLPLIAAIVAGLGGRVIGRTPAKVVTTGALFIAAFLSWPILLQYISGEAQPIVYRDVIYVITGADDVFAIDAKTGATKWSYRADLNQKIPTVCCGWTNRG